MGAGGVGKSCLTVRFLKDEFSSEYDPTIGRAWRMSPVPAVRLIMSEALPSIILPTTRLEENYRKNITVDGKPLIVNIVDTAGQVGAHSYHTHDTSFIITRNVNNNTTPARHHAPTGRIQSTTRPTF